MLHLTRQPRRAVILIMTLLLLLLLVVVVGQLSYTTSIDRILAANQSGDLIVDQAIQSGIQYSIAILLNDLAKAEGEGGRTYDAPNEPWAAAWQQKVGEASITGQLRDQEGKYNLLWIFFYSAEDTADQAKLEAVKQELLRVLSDLREGQTPDGKTLTDNISAWIEGQQKQSVLQSKILQELQGRSLGGSAAPIYSISELLLVSSIDKQVLYGELDPTADKVSAEEEKTTLAQALVKHLTLWGNGKININTASKSVLMSIHGDMTSQMAQAIIDKRQGEGTEGKVTAPFKSAEDALAEFTSEGGGEEGKALAEAAKQKIDVVSNVFVLDITATWKTFSKRVWVVLKRDPKQKTVTILQYLPR